MLCNNLWKNLLGAVSVLVATSAAADVASAQFNTSTVHTEITYTFAGAKLAPSGEVALDGFDYEFDGPPSHFFEFPTVFSMGDGTGSIAGSATLGDTTHTYDEESPDFDSFDFFTDNMTIIHDTYGQSSLPNSNGSADINSAIDIYLLNLTSDDITGDAGPLTFLFDYEYLVDMSLVTGSPAGGQANGFFEVTAEAILDSGDISIPGIVQEFYGGPASLNGLIGSGQISFDIPANNSVIQLVIHTSTNSTTLTLVPEPASLALLAVGALVMLGCAKRPRRKP